MIYLSDGWSLAVTFRNISPCPDQAKQREISAGLRDTYDKLVKSGMMQAGVNPDGTPEEMPDMDEVRVLL